ncbi:MAG TPA: hypothetical protein VN420_03280 [Candidatus Fimivivens sp.]|nr:hypothetical protein [Candidatus Fimivivens sp.]
MEEKKNIAPDGSSASTIIDNVAAQLHAMGSVIANAWIFSEQYSESDSGTIGRGDKGRGDSLDCYMEQIPSD